MGSEACVAGQRHGLQPDFGAGAAAVNMHVRWFTWLAAIEIDAVAICAQYCWHGGACLVRDVALHRNILRVARFRGAFAGCSGGVECVGWLRWRAGARPTFGAESDAVLLPDSAP